MGAFCLFDCTTKAGCGILLACSISVKIFREQLLTACGVLTTIVPFDCASANLHSVELLRDIFIITW